MAKKEKGKWVLFLNHAQQMYQTQQMRPESGGMIAHEGVLLTPGHLSAIFDDKDEATAYAETVQEYLQKDLNAKVPNCGFPVYVKVIEIAGMEKVEGKKLDQIKFDGKKSDAERQYEALPKTEKEKLKAKAERDKRRE